jgi:hypothetical protein
MWPQSTQQCMPLTLTRCACRNPASQLRLDRGAAAAAATPQSPTPPPPQPPGAAAAAAVVAAPGAVALAGGMVLIVENSRLKVGIDPERGGAISWLGRGGSADNLLNAFDCGRFIQQRRAPAPGSERPSPAVGLAGGKAMSFERVLPNALAPPRCPARARVTPPPPSYYGEDDGSDWNGQPWRWNPCGPLGAGGFGDGIGLEALIRNEEQGVRRAGWDPSARLARDGTHSVRTAAPAPPSPPRRAGCRAAAGRTSCRACSSARGRAATRCGRASTRATGRGSSFSRTWSWHPM